MKKVFAAALLLSQLAVVSVSADYNEYRKGYNDGFKTGWCDGKKQPINICIAPIAPIPPVPSVGRDNYQGGFADGYKNGYDKAT